MSKWLVITGGSHGVGKKTIAHFLQHGYRALSIARTNCDIDGVVNINIDLSKSNWSVDYAGMLSETVKDAERICLVHNAALFPRDAIGQINENDLQKLVNVNLVAPLMLNNIIIPQMKPGSSIIYIGSTLSEIAVQNRASYIMSKHAMVGMMRSTCQDLAAKFIHTCCICPGFLNTKMLTDEVDAQSLKALVEARVVAKRLLEPEEIAEFIYFRAEHPMVNGSVMHANLGQVMS